MNMVNEQELNNVINRFCREFLAGIAIAVVIFLLLSFAWVVIEDQMHKAKMEKQAEPKEAILLHAPSRIGDYNLFKEARIISVGITIDDYVAYSYWKENDKLTRDELETSGRIILPKSGTKVLILSRPTQGYEEIKILDGPYKGIVGFTSIDHTRMEDRA